jgi:hypothetical protein
MKLTTDDNRHLASRISTTGIQRMQLSIGAMCCHNLTQQHYDLMA